jgi:hypothetical protein
MTQLLSTAFDFAAREAAQFKFGQNANGAVILLVDEADALAQSREGEMHRDVKLVLQGGGAPLSECGCGDLSDDRRRGEVDDRVIGIFQ